MIRTEIKKTFQNPADSWKKKIPINTVPIAPIPVQTAYAVPIGIVCIALVSNQKLRMEKIKNPIDG